MNRFAAVLATAWVVAWAGAAQAATDYAARLDVGGGLPALRTGNPNVDGPRDYVGHWTTYSDPRARAFTRDLVDGTPAPWEGNSDMHRSGGFPGGLGEARGTSWLLDRNSSAIGDTRHSVMGASGYARTVGQSEIDAAGSWSRGFSLDAHSSLTFSGLATLSVTGDDAPLDIASLFTIDAASSFASLVFGDVANRVRTEMSAAITSAFTGDWASVFSYSVGPGGLLALTVTNTTDRAMTGQLGAGAYVSVSAPVPEPETYALLLAGVLLVGFAVRRRQPALPGEALAA